LELTVSIFLYQSGGPSYTVELGRYDGLVSKANLVDGNLQGPDFNLTQLINICAKHDLTLVDLVALSGAHSWLLSLQSISNRLYNYNGQYGATDPTINPMFAEQMKMACPTDTGYFS
jgi:peroxidase